MRVAEIFESISGEPGGFATGSICTFIRLQGCNLKCDYCDSPETQKRKAGIELSIEHIIDKVRKLGNMQVLITGGEPLTQDFNLWQLIDRLWCFNHEVQIETNGTISPISELLDYPINWVVDYKTGNYNFLEKNWNDDLFNQDFSLKFIIENEKDINEAINIIKNNERNWDEVLYIFSPMNHILTPADNSLNLAQTIFDKIKNLSFSDKCIIGHQLHKYFKLA